MRYRVPGSTTNLGHGFDCLGMALGVANTICVMPSADDSIRAPDASDDGLGRMAAAVREVCGARWQVRLPGFTVTVAGDVPEARGMGSSCTILLGVAAACQRLAGRAFERQELLEITAEQEGHPDNATASCMGGLTIAAQLSGQLSGGVRWQRFDVPTDLVAVIAIPPYEVKTSEARRILPPTLTRAEAVIALQRSALITAMFATGRIAELRGLFDDAWHEHHRTALNPGLTQARQAAANAGAIGTVLSGSGSTVLSFVHVDQAPAVARAVKESYAQLHITVQMRVLPFDNVGLTPIED